MFAQRLNKHKKWAVQPMQKKRCFVISPIGADNSEVREHADDVFEYIIKPALKNDYDVHRGDHNSAPGKITDQMFADILGNELLVAILTFKNPNVFYELAVAQSAGRPIILLNHKGHEIPFDLKDLRVIHYDLRPRPLFEGVYSNLVQQAAAEVVKFGNSGFVPFAPLLKPLGAKDGSLTIFRTRGEFGNHNRDAFLSEAKTKLDILSISNLRLLKQPGVEKCLRDILASGCRVRVLLLDPSNPALPQILNEFCPPDTIRSDIKLSISRWQAIGDGQQNFEIRPISVGMPLMSLMQNDSQVVWSAYCYHGMTSDCPLLRASSESHFYGWLADEFEKLWEVNGPASPGKAVSPARRPRLQTEKRKPSP